jgi:outer membrane protein assembly factor BamB
MTQLGPDASVIELGAPGIEDRMHDGPELPVHLRRRLLIVLLTLFCVLTLAASMRGRPGLGDPLWTGSVSLNGFTVGTHSLYKWRLDGKAVTALDLFTGRPRWSRDVTDLPESIMDLGRGVAVVATKPPFVDGVVWQGDTITLVRNGSGERIAQTVGDYYLPSVDGRLLLVFSRRFHDADGCGESQATAQCVDVTAWDVDAGAVAWKLNLPPNADFLPSMVDGRVDALAEIDPDGTVQLRDVSTGAVAGTTSVSPAMLHASGQLGLVQGMFLTAVRGPEGITVTAYRRPSLNQSWSIAVPDFTATDDRGDGELYLWQCGLDACMMVRGASTWVINQSTGSVTKPISVQVIQRLGGGVFLASPLHAESSSDPTGGQVNGFIIDPDGRTLAKLTVTGLVDWSDSGDRALATYEGPQRTEFRVIDDRGNLRSLGSVAGIRLTCRARADILACSDPSGALRVWRLPL